MTLELGLAIAAALIAVVVVIFALRNLLKAARTRDEQQGWKAMPGMGPPPKFGVELKAGVALSSRGAEGRENEVRIVPPPGLGAEDVADLGQRLQAQLNDILDEVQHELAHMHQVEVEGKKRAADEEAMRAATFGAPSEDFETERAS